jgi:fructose-specific phosphotransferase system IIA component
MNLTQILKPESILVPLEASDKQEAIALLVDLLADQEAIQDRQQLHQAVWQREQTRTTGIGHRVAIPHGKCCCCQSVALAVARTGSPLDFDAIDNEPVELIFLLASPVDQTSMHIDALASISRMLTDPHLRQLLIEADSGKDLFKVICDHESAQVS